jgi:dipeptidase E
MKLLLTSAGVKNDSIRDALVGLLGRPIADSTALIIPTANYAMPGGAAGAWRVISGVSSTPLVELGWKSLGVLELTTLPSLDRDTWQALVREADILLVGGGDSLYLAHWMRESGLAELIPALPDTVWLGVSGGSMVMAPRVGEEFLGWAPLSGTDEALGVVDFAIFPHLDHPSLPENSMADAEAWAAKLAIPAYAIDDQTALQVVDGEVTVVSEGNWRLFPR